MHEQVEKLYKLTHHYVSQLDRMDYDQMQKFLIGRDQLIVAIQRTQFSEQEIIENRKMVMEILSYDEMILAKLQQLKEEVGNEIGKLSMAKQQKRLYDGYFGQSGAYYDTRN